MRIGEEQKISQAIIKRLPRYYRYLDTLREEGVERISSGELARLMGVTASQIRQDLNNFGGFGQQGYGYNVENLHREIEKILCIDREHNVVVVGAGHLGNALARNVYFSTGGFCIKALFDNDPEKIGTNVDSLPIYSMSEMNRFIDENSVEIVILTVPKEAAKEIADKLKYSRIKGILNFTATDLKMPRTISVQNVHLNDMIMRLCYNMYNPQDS